MTQSPQQTVLVVDDTAENIDVLAAILRNEYRVLAARDGETALRIVNSATPDLILLDVVMPDIDGYEVCRRLKAQAETSDIPVIFVSALNDTFDKVRGFAVGGVDYITKPIQPEETQARVKTHLSLRCLGKQLLAQNQQLQQANAEVSHALAQEQELNQLKTRFVSTVTHEFRTPLTNILFSTDLLERYSHQLSEEKKAQHLQRIQAAVRQMADLVDDVLLVSRADANRLPIHASTFDLIDFCRGLREDYQTGIGARHTLALEFIGLEEQAYLPVTMDGELVRRILDNLLSNAFKYSPPGSTVRLSAQKEADQITFCVSDEGMGIPEKDQPHIFEPFHRAENVGTIPGTGLGLNIVRRTVELHGGSVRLESKQGIGTTITATLACLPAVG